MASFDQIESSAWKLFFREQGTKLPVFAILSFILGLSGNLIVHPIALFFVLAMLSGFIDYCLKLAPNLRTHASLKRSGGSDYRAVVEEELAHIGLKKMLNENWFVGERKRRMKSAEDKSENLS
jgi:hypothetical protein